MNEAIGGSNLFSIVIVIVSALVLLLLGFLAFSKAFKVKNHIINFINEASGEVDKVKIESDLISVGYSSNRTVGCLDNTTYSKLNSKENEVDLIVGDSADSTVNTPYDFCVYKSTTEDGSYYYTVLTYVHMNIPLIDSILHIPITGETKIFERKYE